MSLSAPENDLERRVAAQVDAIYESGWNEALDAVEKEISNFVQSGNRISDFIDAIKQLRM